MYSQYFRCTYFKFRITYLLESTVYCIVYVSATIRWMARSLNGLLNVDYATGLANSIWPRAVAIVPCECSLRERLTVRGKREVFPKRSKLHRKSSTGRWRKNDGAQEENKIKTIHFCSAKWAGEERTQRGNLRFIRYLFILPTRGEREGVGERGGPRGKVSPVRASRSSCLSKQMFAVWANIFHRNVGPGFTRRLKRQKRQVKPPPKFTC